MQSIKNIFFFKTKNHTVINALVKKKKKVNLISKNINYSFFLKYNMIKYIQGDKVNLNYKHGRSVFPNVVDNLNFLKKK